MSPIDVGVYGAIAAVALLPFSGAALGWLRGLLPSSRGPAQAAANWRQHWSGVLIDFIDDVEEDGGDLAKPEEALRLARELVWELIGGDGAQASGKK